MGRVIVCLLVGLWCHAAVAIEPVPSANARPYVAKVKYLRVDGGKETMAVATEVTGTAGTPLKTKLAGKNGLVLSLDLRTVPNTTPSQYLAQFKLFETKKDKEIVLSAPTLVTTVGSPAKLMVGQEKGDRIEVEVTVREGAPALDKQPATSAKSDRGRSTTSLMMYVTPRIIIQEEEEEKMGIQPMP